MEDDCASESAWRVPVQRFSAEADAARCVYGDPSTPLLVVLALLLMFLARLLPLARLPVASQDVEGLLVFEEDGDRVGEADRRPVSVPGSVVRGRSCRLV